MIGVASLLGALLGVYFRNAIDNSQTFRQSALVGVRGALMIGVCVGYVFAGTRGGPSALGAGLASGLLTFCLFTPAAISAFRRRGDRVVLGHAVALSAIAVGAGTVGAAVGVLVA